MSESLEVPRPAEPYKITDHATFQEGQLEGWIAKWVSIWLPSIILLALTLRLAGVAWGQAYSYFGQGDAVAAFSVSVKYGHGNFRAQYIGQPNYNSASKLPGPAWALFGLASYRFWGSAENISYSIVLLNTAAVYLVFLLTRNFLGMTAAFWATLLAAVSPWTIYYSTGLYNPNVMSFLSGLLVLAMWKCMQQARSPAICWVPILLALMPQFHMSGLMLIPAVILVFGLSRARLSVGWLIFGIAAGACLYIPYIRGDASQGWQNTRGIFAGKAAGGGGYNVECLKAITAPLSFLSNWGSRWAGTSAEYRELGRDCFGSFAVLLAVNLISVIPLGFMVIGIALEIKERLRGFWRSPRQCFRREAGVAILCVLLFLPLALATIGGKPFHTRYCIVLLPALFPLAGLGSARFLGKPGLMNRLFLFSLTATVALNTWLVFSMYHVQGRNITNSGIFVPSFKQLELVYQQLKVHAGAGRVIEIDDFAYLSNLKIGNRLRDAGMIRAYVDARELETHSDLPTGQFVYELCPAEAVGNTDQGIGFKGHGIALRQKANIAKSLLPIFQPQCSRENRVGEVGNEKPWSDSNSFLRHGSFFPGCVTRMPLGFESTSANRGKHSAYSELSRKS